MVNRCALAALVLAVGGILGTAGTTMAAFQVVHMSATSMESSPRSHRQYPVQTGVQSAFSGA
jgi:hypothetical protein